MGERRTTCYHNILKIQSILISKQNLRSASPVNIELSVQRYREKSVHELHNVHYRAVSFVCLLKNRKIPVFSFNENEEELFFLLYIIYTAD